MADRDKNAEDVFPTASRKRDTQNIGDCIKGDIGGEPPWIDKTLAKRGRQYGNYGHMAEIAQNLKEVMSQGLSYKNMDPAKKESLDMIATKIARIVCGNPDNPDSWHDIGGYAKLAEDRCSGTGAATS